MKVCKDCRHCIPLPQRYALFIFPLRSDVDRYTYSSCDLFPYERKINMATGVLEPLLEIGGVERKFKYASLMRESGVSGACGKDAKLFEPK